MSSDSGRLAAETGTLQAAATSTILQLRARLRVAKSVALFLLPLPLLVVIAQSIFADQTERLLVASAALASFWTAGLLAWRGLAAEMRYILGDQIDLDRRPRKLLSAALTGAGAALAATAAGHSVTGAVTFAGVAAVGHCCFYGLDMRARRVTVTPVDGVDVTVVTQQLEQAHRRLRRIDAAARTIPVHEFRTRLTRITGLGRDILSEIAREPRSATRARRFLNLFLDSSERITEEYARTHHGIRSRPLEEHFRQLLVDMERTFLEQHRRLLENDVVALDVEMEVLNARLKQEVGPTLAEKRP